MLAGPACQCSAGPLDGVVTSGSRLRARFFDGGGGALMFKAWYDTELDIECRFDLAADGKQRCLPLAEEPWGEGTACVASPSLPTARYLAGTASDVPFGDGRLATRTIVADDGSREVIEIVDEKGGICNPSLAQLPGPAEGRCIAAYAVNRNTELDLLVHYDDGTVYLKTGVRDETVGLRLLEMPPLELAAFLEFMPDCQEPRYELFQVSKEEGMDYALRFGPPIAASSLPALPVEKIGSGRLKLVAFVDDAGEPLRPLSNWDMRIRRWRRPLNGTFFDTSFGVFCTVMRLGSKLRCVPQDAQLGLDGHSFSDPACQHEVLAISDSSCVSGVSSTKTYVVRAAEGGCDPPEGIAYEPGAPHDGAGADVYALSSLGCRNLGTSRPIAYYKPAGEVDPTEFVEITELTD
jgi:hypothetical protein